MDDAPGRRSKSDDAAARRGAPARARLGAGAAKTATVAALDPGALLGNARHGNAGYGNAGHSNAGHDNARRGKVSGQPHGVVAGSRPAGPSAAPLPRPLREADPADADHALPPISHRGARVAEWLARAAEVPVTLVDLGEPGGPIIQAADEEEGERFAAAWQSPRQPGRLTIADRATGEPMGHAFAVPLALSGRTGWLAAIAPGGAAIAPRAEALVSLIGELCADRESERRATRLWTDRLQAESAVLSRVHELSGLGTLSGTLSDGEVTASPRAGEILRHESIESISDLVALVAPHDRVALYRALTGQDGLGRITLECEVCPGGGRSTTARLRISHLSEVEQPKSWIATVEDITDDRQQIAELRRLAERDPLTGLYNRNRLPLILADAHRKARSNRSLVGLLLVAVGGLRGINELHGFATGDLMLRFIADTLTRQVRATDEVMRIGSGEFAVLLSQARDEEAIRKRAETIGAALSTAIVVGIHRIDVQAAIGYAVYPSDTASGLDLFAAASYALNEGGTGSPVLIRRYRPQVREKRDRERALIEEITRALRNNEFTPFFQPKVDLETGAVIGFEALCRWRHPQRGVLTPSAFHQALTSPVVSGELSDVSLIGSAKTANVWRRMGLKFGHIAVNLSAAQLARPNLVDIVLDLKERFALEPTDLSFEVLENVLIRDENAAHDNLRALARAGFTIALDDFGTGFASLTHVREPYIREVKIDRGFVTHAGTNARDQQIVAAIVQMARKLGLRTVAEGIEDEETLRKLRAVGCVVGQGFVFAAALPFDEATEFLGRQHRIFGILGRS